MDKRVLVVEDDPLVAYMLEESLQRIGYIVVGIVSTGPDAIRKAGEAKPDVVLMDIHLQGSMDGIAAAEKIMADWRIPIIFLTASTDEDTIQRAIRTKSQSYLVKPIQMKELFANIELAIHKKRVKDLHQEYREAETEQVPTCTCKSPMMRTYASSGKKMVPLGWICPKCHAFLQ
jgi:CheY-like chemotaxis protein